MSRSMPRVMSRWKGAALIAAAAAIVPALAVSADPTLTVDLKLSPLGSAGLKTTKYVSSTAAVPIYVYATIDVGAGNSPTAAPNIAGLEYLYYSIAAASTGTSKIAGSLTATLNTSFTTNGSQAGTISAVDSAIASKTVIGGADKTDYAKPRNSTISWATLPADGTNVVVSGSKVSFLVETLSFTPTAFNASTIGALNSVTFSPGVAGALVTTPYSPATYFGNESTVPTPGSAIGDSKTFAAISAGSSVTIIDTIAGDTNLDGNVNGTDLAVVGTNFNKAGIGYANGDFDNNNIVNGSDLAIIGTNFNKGLGVTPSAVTAAAVAVPEPASIGLLALGGLVGLSRRRRKA